MTLLLGALTLGLLLALMALGIFVTFRLFRFADLATDSILTLGAAVTAVLLVRGASPGGATLAGAGAGILAGAVTGLLHTRLHINSLLSGILVMTGLYSVNLRVMGGSNVPLAHVTTGADWARDALQRLSGVEVWSLSSWEISGGDLAVLLGVLGVVPTFAFPQPTRLKIGIYQKHISSLCKGSRR